MNGSNGRQYSALFSGGLYRGYEVRLRIDRLKEHERVQLLTPLDLYHFMRDVQHESSEHFYEVLMDTMQSVTGVYLVGKGNVRTTPACPAEIFKAALVSNSSKFAVVHNHPSGDVEPSLDDILISHRIGAGAHLLGVELLDFMIIGRQSYYSFREKRLLRKETSTGCLGPIQSPSGGVPK